ncbi:VOC family protein [Streptomyces sp. p1417]|uniref:VOC family protein n=1 Tax=Streptomyces typhae TaxID=2681492 RepID=A0A6L6X979_9ACTN|nr:VOC family protein [Streptomyces typhae]MVO90404.1 VOC family protein [Streptomyces typhae]
MKLSAITLDCPDPLALSLFYQQATGLEPHPKSNAEFAGLNREDGLLLGFQRVDDYQPPDWPGQANPQQLHICFKVAENLDEVEVRLVELGAGKPDYQPHDAAKARVLTDPAGHPFCVVSE